MYDGARFRECKVSRYIQLSTESTNEMQQLLNVYYLSQLARPRPIALLSPSSDGKPKAATAVVIAPDDGHEDARNLLSCI
jgi:hypothetical protein